MFRGVDHRLAGGEHQVDGFRGAGDVLAHEDGADLHFVGVLHLAAGHAQRAHDGGGFHGFALAEQPLAQLALLAASCCHDVGFGGVFLNQRQGLEHTVVNPGADALPFGFGGFLLHILRCHAPEAQPERDQQHTEAHD